MKGKNTMERCKCDNVLENLVENCRKGTTYFSNIPSIMDDLSHENTAEFDTLSIVLDGESTTIHEYIFSCIQCKKFSRLLCNRTADTEITYTKENFTNYIDEELATIPNSVFGESVTVSRYIGAIAEHIYAYERSLLYSKRTGPIQLYSYILNTDLFHLYENAAHKMELSLFETPILAYEKVRELGGSFDETHENACSLVKLNGTYENSYYQIHPYTYRADSPLEGNCFYRFMELERSDLQLLSYNGDAFESSNIKGIDLEFPSNLTKSERANMI